MDEGMMVERHSLTQLPDAQLTPEAVCMVDSVTSANKCGQVRRLGMQILMRMLPLHYALQVLPSLDVTPATSIAGMYSRIIFSTGSLSGLLPNTSYTYSIVTQGDESTNYCNTLATTDSNGVLPASPPGTGSLTFSSMGLRTAELFLYQASTCSSNVWPPTADPVARGSMSFKVRYIQAAARCVVHPYSPCAAVTLAC